jgi:hypothetical protein
MSTDFSVISRSVSGSDSRWYYTPPTTIDLEINIAIRHICYLSRRAATGISRVFDDDITRAIAVVKHSDDLPIVLNIQIALLPNIVDVDASPLLHAPVDISWLNDIRIFGLSRFSNLRWFLAGLGGVFSGLGSVSMHAAIARLIDAEKTPHECRGARFPIPGANLWRKLAGPARPITSECAVD